MDDSNRRKFPRANYPCLLTIWMDKGFVETILAKTSNVGVGGLCVHLDKAIELGTKIDIQINFSKSTTPFRCRGEVMRCKQVTERLYNIGIQFDPLSELKYAFLEGKISEILDSDQKGKG